MTKRRFFSSHMTKHLMQIRWRSWVVLWVVLLGFTAYLSEGWLQPDEHARVLEPAHFIAYGYASLPWELSEKFPVVSWLIGAFWAPVLMITKFFQLGGLSEAAIIRFATGLIVSTKFIALWDIMSRLGLREPRKKYYLLFMMFAVFGPVFLVRTSQENYAGTALIWAFFWSLRLDDHGFSKVRTVFFTVLLALTASLRPQVGVAAAGLGLWALRKHGPKIIGPSIVGLTIGLMPLALIDLKTVGVPFLPAFNYLRYAVGDEDGGHMWGTSPWWYYGRQYLETWFPPLSPLLLIPLVVGLWAMPVLQSVFVPFALVHMILGHKETRYFMPMLPFFHLSMFRGLEILESKFQTLAKILKYDLFWRRFLLVLGSLTILAGMIPLNSSPWMYEELGRLHRNGSMTSFTYIGNTLSSLSQFYAKSPEEARFKHITWSDIQYGKEHPEGWLAFYALDPDDYEIIETQCGNKGINRYPSWYISMVSYLPRSPARRRLNPIIFCSHPLYFTQH